MIVVFKGVPNLNRRANAGWRRGNPPKEENSIGHQTECTATFLPGFQTKFNLSKSGYDLVFNGGVGGNFKVCNNPPNQEIKVKQGLSRLNKV